MVVFDATMLLLVLWDNVGIPIDPATGLPVERVQERITHCVKTLEKARTRIIVPTPALSEALVRAGKATSEYIDRLNKLAIFQIVEFDTLAAVELALMTKAAIG